MQSKRVFAALALIALLDACATHAPVYTPDSGATARLPADPVPHPEPRSRYGNGPIYEVHGRPYKVLDSSYGYHERGVASWYGPKFHGRMTSTQEPYDMHAMTAAHKTLPLPTYVRVRNLQNNRTVIVRVNDRGPFVDNRIIDLSYAAAQRLDMVRDGTCLVEITAISYDEPPDPAIAPVLTASTAAGSVSPTAADPENDAVAGPPPAAAASERHVFVQVGAFGERTNAERRFRQLTDGGIADAFVLTDDSSRPLLYRVRIGPIADVGRYDALVAALRRLGIADSHLVTE